MYTKGPWELTFKNGHPHQIETVSKKFGEYRHLTNDVPYAAAPGEQHDGHGNSTEQIESLQLMAAAPELLEAMEAAISYLEDDSRSERRRQACLYAFRAATAKAKGE